MASQPRSPGSITRALVVALESIGLLNKGSGATAQDPTSASAPTSAPPTISDNALNVTRVGGLAALVAAVGAAAVGLFGVDKAKDAHSIVVSAYIATGAIVVAGLIAAAWIIAGDARARATAAASPAQQPEAPSAGPVAGAGVPARPPVAPATEVLLVEVTPAASQHRLDAAHDIVLINSSGLGANPSSLVLPSASSASLTTLSVARIDAEQGPTTIDIIPNSERGNLAAGLAIRTGDPPLKFYSNGKQWNMLP